eukprot:CAMPEP_0114496406 /NCGR_PEP_ID=MMETSP0109-20121206/5750_1 /TAXON_ID=29199 /ORGANISM="Chlorarachnion reptans, Strain CCCM449" /LENGTH=519 /DNA_ID=CAMNT_0001673671 /DNA_START=104 /DNA_END=1663 /DNA_ORIENTATION=-
MINMASLPTVPSSTHTTPQTTVARFVGFEKKAEKKEKKGGSNTSVSQQASSSSEKWRYFQFGQAGEGAEEDRIPPLLCNLLSRCSPLHLAQISTLFEFVIDAMETKRARLSRESEKKMKKNNRLWEKKEGWGVADPVVVWDFTSANRFQLGFLHASQDVLRSTLGMLGIAFTVNLGKKNIMLESIPDKLPLRISDVRAAALDVERIIEHFVEFDYRSIISTMVEGCATVLAERCEYLEDESAPGAGIRAFVSGMKPKAIVFDKSEGDGLRTSRHICRYYYQEPEDQHYILYVDPKHLNANEVHSLMKDMRCERKGQLQWKLAYYYASFACREVILGLQRYAKLRDSDKFGWCSEFNASFAAGSLFMITAKGRSVTRAFDSGFAFAVTACWLRDSIARWRSWKSNIKNEFLRWRDSYGVQSPNVLTVTANTNVSREFKEVMCVESCFNSSWALQKQLDFLFRDREINVRKFDVSDLPLAIRHRKGSRLPVLNCPVSTTVTPRNIDCCETPYSTVCYASTV